MMLTKEEAKICSMLNLVILTKAQRFGRCKHMQASMKVVSNIISSDDCDRFHSRMNLCIPLEDLTLNEQLNSGEFGEVVLRENDS